MFSDGKRTIAKRASARHHREAQGDDPAAVVTLAPIEPKMRRRAMRAARRCWKRWASTPDDGIEGDLLLDVSEEVSRELMRLGIVASKASSTKKTGEPFALTPDRETRLRTANDVRPPDGHDRRPAGRRTGLRQAGRRICHPDAMRRAEKNALSGSPNGTSTGATPGKDTANSPARRKRKGRCEECPYKTRAPNRRRRRRLASPDGCQRQLRTAGMAGVPIGLDFGAIMLIGAAQDADLELLAEVLPDFEAIVIAAWRRRPDDDFRRGIHLMADVQVSIRLGTTGRGDVERDFAAIGDSGEAQAKRYPGRLGTRVCRSRTRAGQAGQGRRAPAAVSATPVQQQINATTGVGAVQSAMPRRPPPRSPPNWTRPKPKRAS
jgi:hypothetical protein